jgi:deoxycytidylate deaminase
MVGKSWTQLARCLRFVPAELAILAAAARQGIPTEGTYLYLTLTPDVASQAILRPADLAMVIARARRSPADPTWLLPCPVHVEND